MANYTYGSGTANQFTTGEQRQVLELGKKIHMFNPDVTPIFTLMGRTSTLVTPVPIFEWMEDEFFIRPDIVIADAVPKDAASAGDNDTGFIFTLDRQSQVEGFEKGAVYTMSATMNATNGLEFGGTTTAPKALMCVAIGKECNTSGGSTDKDVRFIASDGTLPQFVYQQKTTTQKGFEKNGTGSSLTLTYVGNAGVFATKQQPGFSQGPGTLANDDSATVTGGNSGFAEGAGIGEMSSKKVRRLSNCTQIFREPFSITGTQNAAKMYGGPEMARLQARKLNLIKMNVEKAILTQGAAVLDATSENPKRTFQGLGVGISTGTEPVGSIKSLNGNYDTELQLAEGNSGTLAVMDGILEKIFQDSLSGSMRKTVFCSNRWLKKLVAMVREDNSTNLVAEMGANATAGLRVTTYYGPIGELEFIVHPLLNASMSDQAVVIDFGNVAFRPLATRDMQLRPDVVKDGRDGVTDEWLIEAGLEVRNEQTHAIMKLT